MSLINKMLQDLDARGGALAESSGQAPGDARAEAMTAPSVRAVSRAMRRPSLLAGGAIPRIGLLVVVLAALAALAAGAYLAWHARQGARASAALPAAPTPVKVVHLKPPPPDASAPQSTVAAPPPVQAGAVAPPVVATGVEAGPRAGQARQAQTAPQPEQKPSPVAVASPRSAPADAHGAPAEAAEADAASTRPMSARHRAEAAYRRALADMQDGRTGEAVAALEQALDIDAGHDAARQTLVGLLVAGNRSDEAMRLLQQGLERDPGQPAMAMLLARLQIERGGTGIETLQRTLPYATGNAEYHAFLAGALQRQKLHGEAAEQYQAALRAMPDNGIWLMGLGISLQAGQRNAEALDAFRKARAAGNLTPELQAFVEARLQQLSR